ncbi:hypothetical protein FDECE_9546 [Fusarium decemcellulare]|nr:hypothetical protein FDECE_9546 [Fusarium decemcellulare]
MTNTQNRGVNGSGSTHTSVPNAKNALIYVGMRDGVTGDFNLVPRAEAVVSVFDSNFLVGDGIWEGIRANKGRVQFAREHINRLFQSAKAMYMDLGLSKGDLLNLIHQTLDANDMAEDEHVHIRLVVSRGLKATPYQNPQVNIGLPLIVIIPESKAVDPSSKARGLRLGTTWVRRGPPDVKDEQWNHISKATDVQACISANVMNVDEALMLDQRGFVKTCNSVNFFIIRGDEVWAPTKDNQMQGITRQKTIDVCRANGITVRELDFSLTEAYGADEAFCTGTFPSQIHVTEIDGRTIGDGKRGAVTQRIQELYSDLSRLFTLLASSTKLQPRQYSMASHSNTPPTRRANDGNDDSCETESLVVVSTSEQKAIREETERHKLSQERRNKAFQLLAFWREAWLRYRTGPDGSESRTDGGEDSPQDTESHVTSPPTPVDDN